MTWPAGVPALRSGTVAAAGIEHQPDDQRIAELLLRMRQGERDAAAMFLTENAGLIRRRFRTRLGRALRRMFDSQDLFSTVARRLDEIVMHHNLHAGTEAELWSLINTLASHALSEHVKRSLRHRSFCDPALVLNRHETATSPAVPDDPATADDRARGLVALWLDQLESGTDRRILLLRVSGREHAEIGADLGMTTSAVRKRWQRIRTILGGVQDPDRGDARA
jgi:RNA polymerase sigma factor (sigma-70 family)